MLVRSKLLSDIAHGFSTREGGVSRDRYATLNLGGKWGDDPEAVRENRRRLAAAGGFAVDQLRIAKQVHGNVVVDADTLSAATLATTEADAVIASQPGLVPAVLTADCVPILISDGAGLVAAVHAGWRGTVAGIAAITVQAMAARGSDPTQLRAAIGPAICAACFEVGDEVAAQFEPIFVQRSKNDRAHVDLFAANVQQLEAAGLRADAIEPLGRCTQHEPEAFYSFRRDGANIGQQLSFIVAGRPAARP